MMYDEKEVNTFLLSMAFITFLLGLALGGVLVNDWHNSHQEVCPAQTPCICSEISDGYKVTSCNQALQILDSIHFEIEVSQLKEISKWKELNKLNSDWAEELHKNLTECLKEKPQNKSQILTYQPLWNWSNNSNNGSICPEGTKYQTVPFKGCNDSRCLECVDNVCTLSNFIGMFRCVPMIDKVN